MRPPRGGGGRSRLSRLGALSLRLISCRRVSRLALFTLAACSPRASGILRAPRPDGTPGMGVNGSWGGCGVGSTRNGEMVR